MDTGEHGMGRIVDRSRKGELFPYTGLLGYSWFFLMATIIGGALRKNKQLKSAEYYLTFSLE